MKTFSLTYAVRSYECGPRAEIAVPRFLDYMQETASEHARALAIDEPVIDTASDRRGAWVLAHLRLEIDRLPKWRQNVTVETFPHSVRAITADRDFKIWLDDGTLCAKASTRWTVIDRQSRRAVRIPHFDGVLESGIEPVFGPGDPFLRLKPPTAAPDSPPASKRAFQVMRAHIDLNGHVNNAHYAAWMLESVPDRVALEKRLCRLDISFRSETLAGETVEAVSVATGQSNFFHRVCAQDGSDHVFAASSWV
jgi:acyl-ACP thioesterase